MHSRHCRMSSIFLYNILKATENSAATNNTVTVATSGTTTSVTCLFKICIPFLCVINPPHQDEDFGLPDPWTPLSLPRCREAKMLVTAKQMGTGTKTIPSEIPSPITLRALKTQTSFRAYYFSAIIKVSLPTLISCLACSRIYLLYSHGRGCWCYSSAGLPGLL